MSQENVAVVQAMGDAWNDGDMYAFRELLAPTPYVSVLCFLRLLPAQCDRLCGLRGGGGHAPSATTFGPLRDAHHT